MKEVKLTSTELVEILRIVFTMKQAYKNKREIDNAMAMAILQEQIMESLSGDDVSEHAVSTVTAEPLVVYGMAACLEMYIEFLEDTHIVPEKVPFYKALHTKLDDPIYASMLEALEKEDTCSHFDACGCGKH